MKDLIQKIMDTIITNTIWEIIISFLAFILSITFIQSFIQKVTTEHSITVSINIYILILLIIIIVVLLFLVIYQFRRYTRLFPRLLFNYKHKHNIYTLTFVSREKLEYTKSIEVETVKKSIKEFKGEIWWTGNKCEPHIVEQDEFELSCELAIIGCQKYIVSPKYSLNKFSKYTLYALLEDINHTMHTRHSIYVQRPTRSITLNLCLPSDIKIKDVKYSYKTKFGEKEYSLKKRCIPNHTGGINIGYDCYTYKIKSPKLFCEYEISWRWESE